MTARGVGARSPPAIANRQAVVDDIIMVTTSCMVIVILSIGFYFRRLRAIPLTGIPAAIGAAIAFAVAELAFGYLTESTSFLGSIIVGNGINYAIVLMSRYEEHRARGEDPDKALGSALAGVWRGTLVASISASAAYASLMVTSFRGFYQFGVMGAVGSLACWVATFTALPALLVAARPPAGAARPRAARPPHRVFSAGAPAARRSGTVTAVFTLLVDRRRLRHAPLPEGPVRVRLQQALRVKLKTTASAQQFNHSVDHLFGRWPSPTIVLADGVDEVEPIKQAIRRQDRDFPGRDVIGQVVTIWDLLPGVPEVQQRKLALIAQIRKLTHDPSLELLNAKEKADLAKIDPPDGLHELAPADLPAVRAAAVHRDGRHHRAGGAGLPAREGLSVWNGRDLLRIASVLQYLHLPNGKVVETSGSAVVFSSMIRSILRDGPIATAASLIAVLIIISFTIRPAAAALMALATLMLGVLLMVGGAGWAQVRVTFLNFIALPDHLRHRRRIRAQRHHPLPRGEGRREGGRLDRRGGRALLLDHDRRLRLAAGRAQPSPPGLRPDGDPGRGRLPLRRHRRPFRRCCSGGGPGRSTK